MMNDKPVVPLTTPPTKKMNIGIKIGIVFAISFVIFMVCTIVRIFFGSLKLNFIFTSLLTIALPILVIIIGIPLVLILHYAIK